MIDVRHRLGEGGDAMLAGHVFDFECDHGFFQRNGLKGSMLVLVSMGRSTRSCKVPDAEMVTETKFLTFPWCEP